MIFNEYLKKESAAYLLVLTTLFSRLRCLFSVPGISAPGPTVPSMPDRIVIHSDPKNNTPALPQEKLPPPPKQPAAPPQQSVVQDTAPENHMTPVKSRLSFPKKLSDTLELKKIPRDLNNIAKLNEHFQRFGAITNIQVRV